MMESSIILPNRPSPVKEEALHIPEVLACILFWLSGDKRALRSARLVSKHFLDTANRFFRIHLNAEYALRHNCIPRAAAIIGGLTLTSRGLSIQSSDDVDETMEGLSHEDRMVDTDFCSLVAQHCIHLERLVIVLEGSYSEKVPLLFSALLSQHPERAAVFRIKELEVVVKSNFQHSIRLRSGQMPLFESSTGLSWTTPRYAPAESSLARLEKLTLQMGNTTTNGVDVHSILEFQICPEVAFTTSFLGPAFISNLRAGSALVESLKLQYSRTFRALECHTLGLSVDQIYWLKELAPALEELQIWEIFTVDMTIPADDVFARDSIRQPGSLRLKQLRLSSITGRSAKLLLGRLLNPSVLESFHVDYLYLFRPTPPNNEHEDRSNILREIMEEMREGQLSGWPQCGSLRQFGIRKMNESVDTIDWLQELKTIPRFSRLEKICLPISVHEFVEIFDGPVLEDAVPAGKDPLSAPFPTAGTTDATRRMSAGDEGQLTGPSSPRSPPRLPFPACSSLLSVVLNNSNPQTNEASDGSRFAYYLTRWLPQLKHLDTQGSSFSDISFLDIIAPPPRPSTLSWVSTLMPSLQADGEINGEGGKVRQDHSNIHHGSHDINSHGNSNGIGSRSLGLFRLESLAASFEFLSLDEFSALPRSEHLLELLERKSFLLAQLSENPYDSVGLYQCHRVERQIRAEEEEMLLKARSIEAHGDRGDQLLAILARFQKSDQTNTLHNYSTATSQHRGVRTWPWIKGLKEISFSQVGMPKIYLRMLNRQIRSLYPDLEWKSASRAHRIPGRN